MDAVAAEQKYNYDVVRWFIVMAVVYLVVGALGRDDDEREIGLFRRQQFFHASKDSTGSKP